MQRLMLLSLIAEAILLTRKINSSYTNCSSSTSTMYIENQLQQTGQSSFRLSLNRNPDPSCKFYSFVNLFPLRSRYGGLASAMLLILHEAKPVVKSSEFGT